MGYVLNQDGTVTRDGTTTKGNNYSKGNRGGNNKWWVVILIAIVAIAFVSKIQEPSTPAQSNASNIQENRVTEPSEIYPTTQQQENVIPQTQQTTYNDVEYVAEQASVRQLDYDDIKDFSKGELRIVRNWIYARHGYAFKSSDLQQYFGRKNWYSPMYSDVSSSLTNIERNNVEFIKQYE